MQNTNQTTEKSKGSNGKWSQGQKGLDQGGVTMDNVTETARQFYDQAVEKGADFISQANKRANQVVREHPVYATLGGLFIGFLLGASLLGRRSHREGTGFMRNGHIS